MENREPGSVPGSIQMGNVSSHDLPHTGLSAIRTPINGWGVPCPFLAMRVLCRMLGGIILGTVVKPLWLAGERLGVTRKSCD